MLPFTANLALLLRFMLFKDMGLRVQNNFEHCILPNEITFCDWRMNDIDWKWDPVTGRSSLCPFVPVAV
jgi:hypothetical protein